MDEHPTGDDLLAKWIRRDGHPDRYRCPGCGASTNVAIVDLAYTFEPCACGDPEYDHLIEILWHRTCLVAAGPEWREAHLREAAWAIDRIVADGSVSRKRIRAVHRDLVRTLAPDGPVA